MKIWKKLILAFLIVSLSALAVAGVISYIIAKSSITERVLDQLESVAAIQKNRLGGMIDQNLERLALVASRTQLRLSLKAFNEKPEQVHQDKMNRILQDAGSSIACFREISVLDLKGKVVASTNGESVGRSHVNEEYFLSGQVRSRADVLYLDEGGELRLRLSGPLMLESELIGVVAIEADADNLIALANDHSGLGKTGETLLLMKSDAGHMVFITPARFDRNAALRRTISVEKDSAPTVTGIERVVHALDYRNKPVLQVSEHIEKTGWQLVVKIDRAEAFAPVTRLSTWLFAAMLVAAIAVVLVSFRLARTITKPVISLTRATKKVAKGDLSFRVEVASDDEVGILAQAFNDMSRELEESQRVLTTLMGNLPGMAYRCRNDKDWTMEFVSDGCLALTGYKPADLIGNNKVSYAGLIHPDDRQAVWDQVQAGLNKRKPFRLEYRISTAQGNEKWVWEQGRGIFSAEGELLSLEGFITDITRRKEAEKALHKTNRVLKTLSECNQILVRAGDESELLQKICRIIVEIGGYRLAWVGIAEHDEAKTVRPVAQAGYEEGYLDTVNITWADTERGCGPTGRAIRTGKPVISRHITTDPEFEPWRAEALKRGYASSIAFPLIANGRPLGALNIYAAEPDAFDEGELKMLTELADDTAFGIMALHMRAERELAEKALRESEQKYRDILENISDLVQSMAPDGSLLYVNQAWLQILGYSEEEVTELSLFDIIHPDSVAHYQEIFKRVLSGESISNIEAVFVGKNGKEIMIEGSASCKFVDGQPVATFSIFRDVTDRKKAEEAQRKLEAQQLVMEELRKLDGIKDEFVSIITHELRTPMTPLKSSVEMFLDGSLGEVTEQQKKYLDMMKRNIDRLSQFTTEVLSLSRLQAGRYAVNPGMLSVGKVADSAVELLKDKAQGKSSTIKLDIDAGLQAYADANALAQVLTNLVNNAIVHAGDGIEIVLSGGKLDGDFIKVSVADNGQGIPEEALPHLFDRFYQADRKKAPGYQGTGIGLSLCQGLVEAMGGEISVESKEGEGTTFRFALPTLPPGANEEKTEK